MIPTPYQHLCSGPVTNTSLPDGYCFRKQGRPKYLTRGIRFLALDPVEHLPQTLLELLVLRAGVEFADEVAASLEGVAREAEGRGAEVLQITEIWLTFPAGAPCTDECDERG